MSEKSKSNYETDIIYADHNATTPMTPVAIEEVTKLLGLLGNPSSSHVFGRKAKALLEDYRLRIAMLLNVEPGGVVFMSGGTEVNNSVIHVAIQRYMSLYVGAKPYVITSKMEHPSVLKFLDELAAKKIIEILFLPINPRTGIIEYEHITVETLLHTALITLQTANNETGVIQPVAQAFDYLMNLLEEEDATYRPVYHNDASQSIGKTEVYVYDVITVTGHKFGGPRIGAMVASFNKSPVIEGIRRYPLFYGGGQEKNARSGTENLPMIGGLTVALEYALSNLSEMNNVGKMRDSLEKELRLKTGAMSYFSFYERLPNTASITFPGLPKTANDLLDSCADTFVASTGAACHSGETTAPSGLLACGLNDRDACRTIRFSLSRYNTTEEVEKIVAAVSKAVKAQEEEHGAEEA